LKVKYCADFFILSETFGEENHFIKLYNSIFFTKYCSVDGILPEHLRGASLPGKKANNTSSLS